MQSGRAADRELAQKRVEAIVTLAERAADENLEVGRDVRLLVVYRHKARKSVRKH